MSEQKPVPIWITKWWMSSGIQEATAWAFPGNPKWCVVATGPLARAILQADQWFTSEAEARKHVEAARLKSIEYHRNRLAELEALPPFTE